MAKHPYGWSLFWGIFLAAWAAAMLRNSGLATVIIGTAVTFVLIFGLGSWYWGVSRRGEKWQDHFDATHEGQSSDFR